MISVLSDVARDRSTQSKTDRQAAQGDNERRATLRLAVALAVVAFVWLLRRNSAAHDRLAARARLYDARLTELHQQAQAARALRRTAAHV